MKKHLKLGDVNEAIQSAFLPFQCTIESIGTGTRFRFRVFDENENVLSAEGWNQRICDQSGFRTIISTARARLERKGFHLQPWDSPFSDEDA